MRVLFLSRWYPYPPDNGSKIRINGLLRGLCERHEVTLISFFDPREPRSETPAAVGPTETRLCAYREFEPRSPQALLGVFARTPRYLVDTYQPEMERQIREVVVRTRFDVVIASQLSMAVYYRAFDGIPAVFEEVELGIYWPGPLDGDTTFHRLRRQITWLKHRHFIARLVRRFRLCTVASEIERELLAAVVPGFDAVHVVPNCVDVSPVTVPPERAQDSSLIFTGSLRYAPNLDAMRWFVGDILPLVRRDVPRARLTITGEIDSNPLGRAEDVVLAGRVADVRPLLAGSAVSIAPIRQGGGTRLKILEAMAVGTPVVATSKAVEGLNVRHGEHVLIADTAPAFAAAVSRILRNPAEAHGLADRAWRLCRTRYDARVVVPQFLELVGEAAA